MNDFGSATKAGLIVILFCCLGTHSQIFKRKKKKKKNVLQAHTQAVTGVLHDDFMNRNLLTTFLWIN